MHASRASVMHLAAQKIRRHRVAGLITQRSQVRILSPLPVSPLVETATGECSGATAMPRWERVWERSALLII